MSGRRLSAIASLVVLSVVAVSSATWTDTSTGPLAAPMRCASIIELTSGEALIFGDIMGAPAELYDAVAGTFSVVSPLVIPGAGASGTLLADGRVFAAGGAIAGSHTLTDAALFDPSTNAFTALATHMLVGRYAPMMTTLTDDRVLIAGGQGDAGMLASAEIFDPSAHTFTATGSMAIAHLGTATRLLDGRVLMAGGAGADGSATAMAEIYDPAADAFIATGSLQTARRSHQAALLSDGRVLIAGGFDAGGNALASAEIFDPTDATFVDAGAMLNARGDHRAVALASGDVLIIGGRNASGLVATAEIYSNGAFAAAADLQEPRWTPAATMLADGRVLVAGGRGASGALASAELFQAPAAPPVQATATLTNSPLQRQYSDRELLTATVTPANAATSVTFKIGTQVLGSAPVVAGTATLNPQLLGPIGVGVKILSADFQASAGYAISSPTRSMQVLREDARVAPTSPTTVNTGCSTCKSTTVHLRATVNDISLVSPATDPDPGDVGTATVSFVNRATGATIATVPVVPNPQDHRTGTAAYDWPVTLATGSSQTFTIGVVVGGQYIRNSTTDDMSITVVKR